MIHIQACRRALFGYTILTRTPTFKWYVNVVQCGFKSIYQKDTCLKEIGLCVLITINILGFVAHIIGA